MTTDWDDASTPAKSYKRIVNSPIAQAGTTQLQRMTLKNFRRFSELRITFEDDLTVIVAENGGGKSAVLDGIAVALHAFVDEMRGAPAKGFKADDVRVVRSDVGKMMEVLPTVVEVSTIIDGVSISWDRALKWRGGRTTWGQSMGKAMAQRLKDDLIATPLKPARPGQLLPVIAYYGTGRLWSTHKVTEGKVSAARNPALQTSAYVDALSSSSSYGQFAKWFENVVREAQNEQVSGESSPHRPSLSKSAVVRAVDTVLAPTSWRRLDWDFLNEEIVATHDVHGRLPVSRLSDGTRNLLALVADLAHRAVRLNPSLGEEACRLTSGIVLIDEVDMHLHPSWQQRVLPLLREAFPLLQFIVTTHSPLVISTVPSRSIRILGDNDAVHVPTEETEGFTSTFALASVFGVESEPPGQFATMLRDYRRLIEDGAQESPVGRGLRESLEAHFGGDHPAIVSLQSFARLMAFKRKRA